MFYCSFYGDLRATLLSKMSLIYDEFFSMNDYCVLGQADFIFRARDRTQSSFVMLNVRMCTNVSPLQLYFFLCVWAH